jgi:hypothetical protein
VFLHQLPEIAREWAVGWFAGSVIRAGDLDRPFAEAYWLEKVGSPAPVAKATWKPDR